MTPIEIKKNIAEATEQDWFNSINVAFSFPYININKTFTGFSSIYEFVNQQISGWEEFGDNLPPTFKNSKTYFSSIRDNLVNLIVHYKNHNVGNLNNQWNNIANIIRSTNNFPFCYECPETEFLIKIHNENNHAFLGAHQFIIGKVNQTLNDKNILIGTLLAYEFTLKDNSQITERRNAEKSSINKIRNDFHKYLSDSEIQLTEHLYNANQKYSEYSKAIDELKSIKETLFSEWFDKSKKEFNTFDEDSKTKAGELERAYEALLSLKKPAEYWNRRAQSLKKQGWIATCIMLALVTLSSVSLYYLLWITPDGLLKSFFNDDKSIALRWSIIFIVYISLNAYCIKIVAKIMFSSFHLSRDAEEREQLTFVYLSLLKESSIEKEDRILILQSLFSRADTGLLKDESSPSMPGSGGIIDKLMRN